ncbi:uncharacterized protein SPPG_05023 [Spizellomyces punctatus DAOM BR117]|uniref:Uncharacterized protein n=1 Tax=Spizellomyces punctatus (strain DAOM BR117) TaxID=645134 RepID=A0A0L0HDW6_SPIPD|nr:uncharacterized protein SPPG_05023 [Spizellomyces punctatus DAOM BR117]KNC99640.1 hypothetical protein SPPG_05023 [Spizellomyces punctatus DAOM BR117]|eukprot:XP_016607680.1 hypothetical protein SPPG_05023 [Spizellomyces punctatus DAOM BR117]
MQVQEDTAVESHGLFQFAEDDEWLFQILQADEPVAPKRQRHFIDWSYRMNATLDGWFHKNPDPLSKRFNTKLGPNELVNAMEHHYLYKNYDAALSLSLEYLHLNSALPKPMKAGEALEIAGRCALKLGRVDQALLITEPLEMSKEPGQLFFRAHLLRLNHRPVKALDRFITYLNIRTNDPNAWQEIAAILSLSKECKPWALLSLTHARYLLTRSQRLPTPITERNASVVLASLDKRIEQLEQECGDQVPDERVLESFGLTRDQTEYLKSKLQSMDRIGEQDGEDSNVREL